MTTGTAPAPADKSPYVGPRPYQTDERLFGRDAEIQDLYDLLIVERIVLLHSPSGAGKTSLVQAGMIPKLDRKKFLVYKPLRVNQGPTAEETRAGANRYVLSVLRGLEKSSPEDKPIPPELWRAPTLPRFFEACAPASDDSRDEFLFFDQFEEVLTADPEAREAKRAFFDQLGSILRAPHRYALFAMREEFVAALDPFLARIPRGLAARFRLELLDAEAARQAIVLPAKAAGVTIEEDAAEVLIDDLRKVRVQEPDGATTTRDGLFVEPVQLQVVCLRLWQGRRGADLIREQDVPQVVGSVDDALGEYYADQVKRIAGEKVAKARRINERDIRSWCERQLITDDNMRGQVRKEKGATRGLDNRVIEALIDAYLVRAEERRAVTWYELAHDRLIEPIRKSNAAWLKAYKSNVQAQAPPPDRIDFQEALRTTLGHSATADLEIGLHRLDANRYAVELQFRAPDSDADPAPVRGAATFDFEELRAAEWDAEASPSIHPERFDFGMLRPAEWDGPASVGQILAEHLFADPGVRGYFQQACAAAEAAGAVLRVRLFVGPTAPELHALRWELLRGPGDGRLLALRERVLFSRFLSSPDWRPVRPRPREELRALVVIANPSDLAAYKMASVEAEQKRARDALGEIPFVEVIGPATFTHLSDRLREGFDILYLVCHGTLTQGKPILRLESATGASDWVSGRELVDRLAGLDRPPRLVVLASRRSAGTSDEAQVGVGGVLAALGPWLAEAGIPAVVAMQGNISTATVDRFLPVFFRELRRDGQVDRAMAAARFGVRDRRDAWVPVLFLRLNNGCIWYVPGFAREDSGEEHLRWKALLDAIDRGKCTPVLGLGLLEPYIGSTRDIARRWAEVNHFPVSTHGREDLAQVAQYQAVMQGSSALHFDFEKRLREEILRRVGDLSDSLEFDDLLAGARARSRESHLVDPYDVLAGLPFPLYITASPDDQLRRALIDAGKQPKVELVRWNEDIDWPPSVFEQSPDFRPSAEQPLVYHLFGQLREPGSLVLSEDNYLDYLIGQARNNDPIPVFVRRLLSDSALLFLGFRMEEWSFRVMYSLLRTLGGKYRRKYAHIAVQHNPEEGRTLDPGGTRRYLQRYFADRNIRIYWGSDVDFAQELGGRWLRAHPGAPP